MSIPSRPLVSVLIPAYNAGRWVGEAIQSALAQTWPYTEVIVVDDGSRDHTLAVARRFESKNVKVLSQENRGASSARNLAFSLAQGDFIQWLDADDFLAPDKVEHQLRRADFDSETRLLFSGAFCRFYQRPQEAKFVSHSLCRDLEPLEHMWLKLRDNLWMSPAVWLVSRRLTEIAGPWDEELSLDDDGEYFCRVVLASEKVLFVPESRVYKRELISGLSTRTSLKACESLFQSHSTCFRKVLAVEDSQRVREVCLMTLQRWLIYYYPEMTELVEKANRLALELGGRLTPPRLPLKYAVIQKVFGWGPAKTAQRILPRLKLSLLQYLRAALTISPS